VNARALGATDPKLGLMTVARDLPWRFDTRPSGGRLSFVDLAFPMLVAQLRMVDTPQPGHYCAI
jgi:hypothetical protein